MVRCENCGKETQAAKFCGYCGKELLNTIVEENSINQNNIQENDNNNHLVEKSYDTQTNSNQESYSHDNFQPNYQKENYGSNTQQDGFQQNNYQYQNQHNNYQYNQQSSYKDGYNYQQNNPTVVRKSPVIGIILSIILPGLGHIYVGKIVEGIVLMIVYLIMVIFAFLIIPGIIAFILWIYALIKTNEMIEKYNQGLPY